MAPNAAAFGRRASGPRHAHHASAEPGTPGTLRRAILFADLSACTSLAGAMGDQAAGDVLKRFSALPRRARDPPPRERSAHSRQQGRDERDKLTADS
jgi:hypothetical protein